MPPETAATVRYKTDDAVLSLLVRLSRSDRSLLLPKGAEYRFLDLQLKTAQFGNEALFENIATQTPALYYGFPPPIRDFEDDCLGFEPDALIQRLLRSQATDTYPVRFGSGDEKRHLTICETLKRWQVPGTVLGITDLPVRVGDLANIFNVNFLSPWNLMTAAGSEIRRLEMLTAVISTAGKFTDSHSDDLAVCNHCFVGYKLWFAWDTNEGLEAGLEDVERVEVGGKARFSAADFLSLKSACWFIVGPGETIFLPGKFTHRVYTLENYLGVGSFYVAFANLLHTTERWITAGSLWDPVPRSCKGEFAEKLLEAGRNALSDMTRSTDSERTAHGIPAIKTALARLNITGAPHADITSRPAFALTVDAMRRMGRQ